MCQSEDFNLEHRLESMDSELQRIHMYAEAMDAKLQRIAQAVEKQLEK